MSELNGHGECRSARERVFALVCKQARDERLWFVAKENGEKVTEAEELLQRALRQMHAVVEDMMLEAGMDRFPCCGESIT